MDMQKQKNSDCTNYTVVLVIGKMYTFENFLRTKLE